MACPNVASRRRACVWGLEETPPPAQRAVRPPLHLAAVFTLRACSDITHIPPHMQNAEQLSTLSLAMTTEQPPAQKRSLASKGTCWIAYVCGLLKGTLMFCSTIESPNIRSLCMARQSDTLDVLRFPLSSWIYDLA